MACLASTGCMRTGADPLSALSVDPISTSTIQPLSMDAEMQADEAAIAEVIADAPSNQPLPWSNPATGSAGVITTLVDKTATGRTCREFRTSRHAFDGIALFMGQACRDREGEWLVSLVPQSE
ncbi:RT0821/Lpp0805 family surface protein [Hoeflea marina]|nr:RT0821/Lpp0805 family surface protein [Hoeflea marina]